MVEREQQRKAAASSPRGERRGGLAGWPRHGVRRLLRSMVMTLGVLVSQKNKAGSFLGVGLVFGGGVSIVAKLDFTYWRQLICRQGWWSCDALWTPPRRFGRHEPKL